MKLKITHIALGLAVLVGGIGYVLQSRNSSELNEIRIHLETEYADTFALIERHALDETLGSFESIEAIERNRAALDEIDLSLPPKAVYWATWSSDGHHGLEGIDRRSGGEGYSTDPKPIGRNKTGERTLRPGESVEGDPLFVYTVRLPEGRKRVYNIAFYQKEILSQIEHSVTLGADQAETTALDSRPEGNEIPNPDSEEPSR